MNPLLLPAVFGTPSWSELLIIAVLACVVIGGPIIAVLIVLFVARRSPRHAETRLADGPVRNAVVGPDGVLRVELPLGDAWANRPVRVVVEPAERA